MAELEVDDSRCVFLPAFCLPVFSRNRVACVCPPVLGPHSHARKKIRKKYSDFGFFCILNMCR